MILETQRLVLRPIAVDDWRALYPILADPRVAAFWDAAELVEPELCEQLIAAQIEECVQGVAQHWAIEGLTERAFLGACELAEIDWRHRRAEVGFLLARDAWSQGYALEAMQAVVDHAAASGLKRLWARVHAGNERGERLLGKLGFEIEGYLRGHVQRAGERRDCKIYGLLL